MISQLQNNSTFLALAGEFPHKARDSAMALRNQQSTALSVFHRQSTQK